jgi:hypothetical protein
MMMTRLRSALPLVTLVASGVTASHAQEPDLIIQGDYFANVKHITTRDGHLFVVDAQARSVQVFDERGGLRRVIGREGQGPLEFRLPDRLGWLGDTLWVRDTGNQRFALIHADSEVATVPLSYPMDPPHEALPPMGWGEWLLQGGGLVIAPLAPWNVLAQGIVTSLPQFLLDRTGARPRILIERDVRGEVYGLIPSARSAAGGMYSLHPFARGDFLTVAPDGSAIFVLNRAEYRITKYSSDGLELWTRSYPFERRDARTAIAEFASFMDDLLGASVEEQGFASRAAFRRTLERELATTTHWPPVSGAVAAADGFLWIRREAPASSIYFASEDQAPGVVRWELIDPDGRRVSTMRLPVRFEGLHAEAGAIWGVLRNELGVPSVVRYRVERSE